MVGRLGRRGTAAGYKTNGKDSFGTHSSFVPFSLEAPKTTLVAQGWKPAKATLLRTRQQPVEPSSGSPLVEHLLERQPLSPSLQPLLREAIGNQFSGDPANSWTTASNPSQLISCSQERELRWVNAVDPAECTDSRIPCSNYAQSCFSRARYGDRASDTAFGRLRQPAAMDRGRTKCHGQCRPDDRGDAVV